MQHSKLYPLKFEPQYKHRLWAGQQLRTVLGRETDIELPGESWEICGLKDQESVVSNGGLKGKNLRELIDSYSDRLLGETTYKKFGNEFPLLIKFIATAKPLSVQVHPNDELAKEKHNSFGKNEMWYVLDAEKESEIIQGFKNGTTKEDYIKELENQSLENILNSESTHSDDVFYISTGTVHAIGKDILLAEIQQSSDVTYRIYDYNRKDIDGKLRELHTDQALEAIDFQSKGIYSNNKSSPEAELKSIVQSPYFHTSSLRIVDSYRLDLSSTESFTILISLEGEGKITSQAHSLDFKRGETILIPAELNSLNIDPQKDSKLLVVNLDNLA